MLTSLEVDRKHLFVLLIYLLASLAISCFASLFETHVCYPFDENLLKISHQPNEVSNYICIEYSADTAGNFGLVHNYPSVGFQVWDPWQAAIENGA